MYNYSTRTGSEVLQDWDLQITADQVLRALGADPQEIRRRRPALAEIAAWALREGLPLLSPAVACREFRVERRLHERLTLAPVAGGEAAPGQLSGPLVARELAQAERVVVLACTIGGLLEEVSAGLMESDPLQGWALDALGSAAVERLSEAARLRVAQRAAAEGLQVGLPLSPGMIGWPLDQGQKQVFQLLEGEAAGVRLNGSWQMEPRKSLTLALGLGCEPGSAGSACDACSLKETCRYREH